MLQGLKDSRESSPKQTRPLVNGAAGSGPAPQSKLADDGDLLAALSEELRSGEAEGERRLLLAVLEDAIHCYQSHFGACEAHRRRLFDEAELWLMRGSVAQPTAEPCFSFPFICDVLGIDAGYIRRCLREWSEQGCLQMAGRTVA